MRKKGVADVLFPVTRRAVIAAMFRDPTSWWYLSELASALETSPSSLQREIERLTSAAILEQRKDGRRTYYRANAAAAVFEELKGLVRKTMGISDELAAAFRPLERRIQLAMVYGSVASQTDRADSDVDLFVVSDDLSLEDIYRVITPVEKKLRRRISPTLYTRQELGQARVRRNSFIDKIFARERIVIIGSEDAARESR